MDIIEKARVFATAAHASAAQLRKYTMEPYIVHPREVAGIVSQHGGSDAQVAAAWLHDVVEDTGVTIEIIKAEFGEEVADLVGWLTDVSRPEQGNRATRKAIDRAHTAMARASEARVHRPRKPTDAQATMIFSGSRCPRGADSPFRSAGRVGWSNLAVSVRVHLQLPLVAANLEHITARIQTPRETYRFQDFIKSSGMNQRC